MNPCRGHLADEEYLQDRWATRGVFATEAHAPWLSLAPFDPGFQGGPILRGTPGKPREAEAVERVPGGPCAPLDGLDEAVELVAEACLEGVWDCCDQRF